VDESGKVLDFHALRHSFITAVVQSGATVKEAHELARHSTPLLTYGKYAHMSLNDTTRALNRRPDSSTLGAGESKTTGTDDAQALPPTGHPTGQQPVRNETNAKS